MGVWLPGTKDALAGGPARGSSWSAKPRSRALSPRLLSAGQRCTSPQAWHILWLPFQDSRLGPHFLPPVQAGFQLVEAQVGREQDGATPLTRAVHGKSRQSVTGRAGQWSSMGRSHVTSSVGQFGCTRSQRGCSLKTEAASGHSESTSL